MAAVVQRQAVLPREAATEKEAAAPAIGLANPGPLGLLAYGMSTVLLSLANAEIYQLGTMVLAMAVLFGGLAQVIVALMAYRRNDTFSVTAFGGYAFLWLTFAGLLIGQQHNWWPVQNSSTAMGWYLFMWAVFSVGLMVASAVAPRFLTLVLALTAALLGLLAFANWSNSADLTRIAGWEGIVTGVAAIYLAFAFLLNEAFGRTVLPVGGPLTHPAGH